jgi:hypothetical protein
MILEDSGYLDRLFKRAQEDKLAPHEFMLANYYAYGKPKDTVKHESEIRKAMIMMIIGDASDPLARTDVPAKRQAILPAVKDLDEVSFELGDVTLDDKA